MKKTLLLSVVATAFALGGCQTLDSMQNSVSGIFSSDEESVAGAEKAEANTIVKTEASANCPSIQIMTDLQSMTQFTSEEKATADNIVSTIDIADVETSCEQQDKATAIALTITFKGETGPKARSGNAGTANFSYPYFVAVTDANGDILAKEIFAASLSYAKGQDSIKQIETINQLLPKSSEVASYNILIGFQLNETQLKYNREQAEKAADTQ